jgi:hydrogenase 3 maturation protease
MEKKKTSPGTWKTSLQLQLLKQLAVEPDIPPAVAFVGIGNQLRSDDAAGILVARELLKRQSATDKEHVLILDAGHAPENSTGDLRKFGPSLILFVDAANMGEEPGTIRWIPEESIDGMRASTHSLPLSMLMHYFTLELHCKVMLLGIQVRSNEVGESVSPEIFRAVEEVVQGLEETLHLTARRGTLSPPSHDRRFQ